MKDGEPLALSIMTNAGNEIRENIAAIMQDNLEALGFDITLDVLEWGTVLSKALGQQFDMLIIGWIGLGSDPEDSFFWAYRYDAPGSGFNFVSYYNEEVEELLFEAKSTPGCSTEDRGPLYKKIQEFIHEHVPYAYFYTPLRTFAWNSRVSGINPGPWDREYNIHQWYLEP
jgi:peptide/nickel transport system substrate-binding protein